MHIFDTIKAVMTFAYLSPIIQLTIQLDYFNCVEFFIKTSSLAVSNTTVYITKNCDPVN